MGVSEALQWAQLMALIVVPIVVIVRFEAKTNTLITAVKKLTSSIERMDERVDQHDVDIAVLKDRERNRAKT